MTKIKIMLVFGTRPETIKMAPIIKEIENRADRMEAVVVVTAQHRQILDQPLQLFNITPQYDLNIMTAEQSLFGISARALNGLESILKTEQPDMVLVQGDTTTTFIGSLAAYYMKIPVGHVEAGLRTYNKYNPFPEEINRKMTGAVAEFHFVPTPTAQQALLNEGIDPAQIYLTGNTVIDALHMILQMECHFTHPELQQINFDQKKLILLTTHRRESFGQPIEEVMKAVEILARMNPDLGIIFPIHYNPNVRRAAQKILKSYHQIHLIDPLDYQQFAHLMARAYLILTDSGGIQEEATSLGKPTLILRETTERMEGVFAGTTKLVGTDMSKIVHETMALLTDPAHYQQMARTNNLYGNGTAARQICDILETHLKITKREPTVEKIEIKSERPVIPKLEFHGELKNVLTINVEDLGVFNENEVILDIFQTLDFLASRQTRATFFVLGWLAERFPEVILAIREKGHEVATQGYSNKLVFQQDPVQFKDELQRALSIFRNILEEPVLGYRAPSYSIIRKSIWAWDILLESGIRYDSSVFPVKHDLYGIPTAPRFPFIININQHGGLIEFPLATIKVLGENIPIAGGSYLRFYPYWFVKNGIETINKINKPAIMFLRTWELTPASFEKGSRLLGIFRKRANFEVMQQRITNLLMDYKFVPVRDVLGFS